MLSGSRSYFKLTPICSTFTSAQGTSFPRSNGITGNNIASFTILIIDYHKIERYVQLFHLHDRYHWFSLSSGQISPQDFGWSVCFLLGVPHRKKVFLKHFTPNFIIFLHITVAILAKCSQNETSSGQICRLGLTRRRTAFHPQHNNRDS